MNRLVSTRGPAVLINPIRQITGGVTPYSLPLDEVYPGALITDDQPTEEAVPEGIEMDTPSIKRIINQALSGKFHDSYSIRMGDESYYLPSVSEIKQILDATARERRTWVPERYDCDDFAYVLKAFLCSIAYKTTGINRGLSGGIIWGSFSWLDEFHACNWFISSDGIFFLVEPQDGRLFEASECKGSVTFVAA